MDATRLRERTRFEFPVCCRYCDEYLGSGEGVRVLVPGGSFDERGMSLPFCGTVCAERYDGLKVRVVVA